MRFSPGDRVRCRVAHVGAGVVMEVRRSTTGERELVVRRDGTFDHPARTWPTNVAPESLFVVEALAPDWAGMTAEQVVEAIRSRPVVLRPWQRASFGDLWSRLEIVPPATEGALRHVSIQSSRRSSGPEQWLVSGLGEYGKSDLVSSFEEAFAHADRVALEKGWKLLGDVGVPPESGDQGVRTSGDQVPDPPLSL